MGLCLYCNDTSWSCSYTYVQHIRKQWIQSCIQYLEILKYGQETSPPEFLKSYLHISPYEEDLNEKEKDQGQQFFESEKSQSLKYLKSLIQDSEINYQIIKKTPYSLSFFGLYGLKIFVDHSDCDGYFTPGNSGDILSLLSRIYPHLEWIEELFEVFKTSYENKKCITFC
jgi:hypothetical protein